MRLCHHDLRDMKLAISLAFDTRRVAYCGLALCWTIAFLFAAYGALAWSAGEAPFSKAGHLSIIELLRTHQYSPLSAAAIGSALLAWWLVFAWLTGPVMRSAAMDIARDERERSAGDPGLNAQVALAPLLAFIPAFGALLFALLWTLVAYIPGTAGAIIAALLLIPVLGLAVFAGASLLIALWAVPMMGPTAVIEGRDCPEAASRPISYVLQKPGRYLLCLLAKLAVATIAALAGAAALGLGWLIVAAAMWIAGLGPEVAMAWQLAAGQTSTGDALPMLLAGLIWGSTGLLVAWWMAVCLSADVLTYLLMRYRVDGVTFDVITVAEERLELLATAVETAAQAEEARARFDEQQAESSNATP